jgi:hypothetical protein
MDIRYIIRGAFILVGVLAVIGSLVNLLFPEFAKRWALRSLAILRFDQRVPQVFLSVGWCRFVGAVGLVFALVLLAAELLGLFSPAP